MSFRKHFSLTRRQVLAATGTAAAIGAASRMGIESIAHAQMMPGVDRKRRFIFCYFPAGWDQLLFLDPRDPTVYTEEQRSMFLTDVRYQQLANSDFGQRVIRGMVGGAPSVVSFGPAAVKYNADGTPKGPDISRHADKIAIVRGLNMGTVAHEVGYRYFLTGTFPAGNSARGSSVASQIAAMFDSRVALPVVSLRVEAYNETMPGKFSALRVNSLDDLLQVLQRGNSLLEHSSVETALEEYTATVRPCEVNVYDRRGILTRMRDSQNTAQNILTKGLSATFDFLATSPDPMIEMQRAAIRAQYGAYLGPNRVLGPADAGLPGSRAALAALAIKSRVAQCVSVQIGDGTDTHFSDNLDHANRLYPGIASFAALLDDLSTSRVGPNDEGIPENDTWIEHTTLLGFSEFARTPLMNQFGGRDHHLSSSCILAGAGIRGNTVVGRSGEVGMGIGLWDFARNEATENPEIGRSIMPPDIAATLLASARFDPGDHRLDAAIARAQSIAPLVR
jgi:hypothetical protein